MRTEDAIHDATQRMAKIVADKFRSCINDDKFLAEGERIVAELRVKHPDASPVRLAMQAILAQGARFAEEAAEKVVVTVVMRKAKRGGSDAQ